MKSENANREVCLLTVKEVATRLHCAPATVYEHIQNGEIVVTRIGNQKGYRIDTVDLDEFVSARKFRYEERTIQRTRPTLKHLQI